jgi:hypothetical protein
VQDGKAAGVMVCVYVMCIGLRRLISDASRFFLVQCSYNAVNGVPTCANSFLDSVLRKVSVLVLVQCLLYKP